MKERFGPEFPHGRISQTVEMQAGKEFGPEGLRKADIARALNLKENQISDDEWADISEFAVNAGAELMQTALIGSISDAPNKKEVRDLRKRVGKNKDTLIPFHDIFHAAQTYRMTNATKTSSRFAEITAQERYTDSQAAEEELYPLLFHAFPKWEAPLPVLLSTPEGRKKIINQMAGSGTPKRMRESIRTLLSHDTPSTPESRRKEYETLLEVVLTEDVQHNVKGITPLEIDAMRAGFQDSLENPPEPYASFAPRVFNEEWRDNPRLFLDELLDCIRAKTE